MNFFITTLGSYGDVHPFLWIGKLLKEKGHQVMFFTNPYFADLVEREGFDFIPIGTVDLYKSFSNHPKLFDPKTGPRIFWENLVLTTIKESYYKIETRLQRNPVIISSLAFLASRLIQEKHSVKVVTVNLSPLGFKSAYEPPSVGRFSLPSKLPVIFGKILWWLVDILALDPLIGKTLNPFRRRLGLSPVKHILSAWVFSPDLVIGLFPPWWAAPQPDWPPNTKLFSFPLFDQGVAEELPKEVAEFLEGGEPPIVFMPGTLNTAAKDFFIESVAICERLNRRGVFLSKDSGQISKTLPASIGYWNYIPFSRLLPHAALLIHHGGIGTTAQALSAGIPQIIRPMAFDQFDNARRIQRLGVGRTVFPNKYRKEIVPDIILQLLASERVYAKCAALKRFLLSNDQNKIIAEIEGVNTNRLI